MSKDQTKPSNATSVKNLKNKLKIEIQKTQEATKLNEALVASIGDGLIIIDECGIITQVNNVALKMLGYEKKELLGSWLPKVLPSKDKSGKDIPAAESPAIKALLSGQPSSEITSYIKKGGSLFPVAGTAAPFMFDGKPRGTIIVFRDFSLEEAVNQAKDEFVSLASHQLRTPLTSIMLYTQMIKDDKENNLNEELSQHLSKIEASTISMMELVDDFLNIAKLELGKIELKKEVVNLGQIVEDQIDKLETVIFENSIKLNYKKRTKGLSASVDSQLIGEVIHNLLTNAIRYRNRDNPIINVSLKLSAGNAIIAVKDNGIGIPHSAKDKIFERLYRADNAKETQNQGTGLGLYLVKKVVEALEGKIWFEGHEGTGTTFFVSIPKENR